MQLSILLCPALAAAARLPLPQQSPFLPTDSNSDGVSTGFRIPTLHESAIMARRILRHESLATLSTVFPYSPSSDDLHTHERRPTDVQGMPFALMEYIADCEPGTGNPTILAVDIATTFKNARAGSNVTMSLRWDPPHWTDGAFSAARMPRYSLIGYLEEIDQRTVEDLDIKSCFMKKHPDVIWSPGNDIHESRWVRLVVREIYWFGGFGDRSRIGWIPVEDWLDVEAEEIDRCRLPGDEDYSWLYGKWLFGKVGSLENSCPWTY